MLYKLTDMKSGWVLLGSSLARTEDGTILMIQELWYNKHKHMGGDEGNKLMVVSHRIVDAISCYSVEVPSFSFHEDSLIEVMEFIKGS